MFFFLSKTLLHLLLPVIWVLAILLWAFFTRSARKRKSLSIIAIFLFILFSNEWAVTRAFKWWEHPVIPIDSLKQNYDVAVILGGFTDLSKQPRDRVYLSQGADRMMHTLLLYRLGKVKKIIATGGSGIPNITDASEAERVQTVLKLCEVNPNDVLLEPKARNTYENAKFSAELIKANFPKNCKVLVVTSAFHCKRAKACFAKQAISADMFPVDFRYYDSYFNAEKTFIPNDAAWEKWSLIIHEWAGYIIYKLNGYI
jgi:uncharacterized SAM-binding protein YcdF (DUF218 family)